MSLSRVMQRSTSGGQRSAPILLGAILLEVSIEVELNLVMVASETHDHLKLPALAGRAKTTAM